MRKFILASATLAAAFTLSLSAQAGILFPVVPFPGSTSTTVTAINNNNVITGYYTDSQFGAQHGFVGTLDGNYTSFDFPNGETYAYGINDDGYITGFAYGTNDDCPVYGCEYARAPDGTVTPITNKGAPLDGLPQEITKKRKFVGDYFVVDGENYYRYGYVGRTTEYKKDITLPFNAFRIQARGINKNNEITGYYGDNDTHTSPGFLIKNGLATSVSFPDQNAVSTFIEGVNDKGRVVGGWSNKDGTAGGAYFYNLGQNIFNVIDVPGSTIAQARSINNSGLVTIIADNGSFIYCAFNTNCPNMAGAIKIADKWVPAGAGNTRWAPCKDDCLKPSEHRAALSKADTAKIREAIKHDPSLEADLKLLLHP